MKIRPFFEQKFLDLQTSVFQTNQELGEAAADEARAILMGTIVDKGEANLIVATGNSQLTFLKAIRTLPIDWSKVNIFHMDEYIGLAPTHPASFPHFLRLHFVNFLKPKKFYPIPPSTPANAEEVSRGYEELIVKYPADLCVLGIGENGHLAFNDPPFADFDDQRLVKVVRLDEASRLQQVGEGHFKSIEEVPIGAITLTIPALLAAKRILALVPEARKADAVFRSLTGPIGETCPGSILRQTPHAHLFLDALSAQKILPRKSVV
jgi:glucosamine-6-phosphate deaminase